jgi:hypothetical protein
MCIVMLCLIVGYVGCVVILLVVTEKMIRIMQKYGRIYVLSVL